MGEVIDITTLIADRDSGRGEVEPKRKPGEVLDITHFLAVRELEKQLAKRPKSLEKMLNQYYLQFPTHDRKIVKEVMIKFYKKYKEWSIGNIEKSVIFHTKYFILNNPPYSFLK